MEPSLLRIKQVFLFLLGQAAGFCVEKELGAVETKFEEKFLQMIQEFERAVYELTVSAGRQFLHSYHTNDYVNDYIKGIKEEWHPGDLFDMLATDRYCRRCRELCAIWYESYYCPNFESWWVHREGLDLAHIMLSLWP